VFIDGIKYSVPVLRVFLETRREEGRKGGREGYGREGGQKEGGERDHGST